MNSMNISFDAGDSRDYAGGSDSGLNASPSTHHTLKFGFIGDTPAIPTGDSREVVSQNLKGNLAPL